MSRFGTAFDAEASQVTTLPTTGQVRLLDWDDLKAKGIKASKATIYRRMKAGHFPQAVYPGHSPTWVESEIDALILNMIAARDCKKVEG